jgi:hypothetical protein
MQGHFYVHSFKPLIWHIQAPVCSRFKSTGDTQRTFTQNTTSTSRARRNNDRYQQATAAPTITADLGQHGELCNRVTKQKQNSIPSTATYTCDRKSSQAAVLLRLN